MAVEIDGHRCYRLVEEYASLGMHRTGTAVDEVTREWLVAQLKGCGASIHSVDYEFGRFDAAATVVIDGDPVECLPLFYEAVGRADTTDPYTESLELAAEVVALDLDAALGRARASGRTATVLATGSDGRLVAQNRAPDLAGGIPTVLVPGGVLDGASSVEVRTSARVVPGRSSTIVATAGGGAQGPLVITTPLTGWFCCAGERGTGIALTVEIATMLAEEFPVTVVATTGHELEYLGAREYLAVSDLRPRAVLHIGASVAAGDPGDDGVPRLSPMRVAFSDLESPARDRLGGMLAPAGLGLLAIPRWGGEGELWRGQGVPVLSLVGSFRRFHTPEDLTELVTTPEALASVGSSICEAARYLAEAPHPDGDPDPRRQRLHLDDSIPVRFPQTPGTRRQG
ncbi:MAG: hypothetical protein JJLCMIEE_02297 [Acidimicrobiales bacterium]|nr:MAG: hypothetical protein EDR02_14385 [Actinomycetota bacterium]MBV6509229.1 hypothetical protein [Acidimicrobiales bacterium]RIK04038.1 MAG: hypothetical protein DCC48_15160 [Acidobacteriota bacterium]